MKRLLVLVVVLLAGCGGGPDRYSAADVKAAYYRAADAGPGVEGYWVDDEYHSHANFVPTNGLETCPLAQRSDAPAAAENMIEPTAAQPVGEFVVGPKRATDLSTPNVTQGALVFGTDAIAGAGMKAVGDAMAKCPASYQVRGGPSPILGTYSVNSRPLEREGWKGVAQQIAHTYPSDDVYYEDMAHLVVQRANVILYLDVSHRKVVGQRSDSPAKAEAVLRKVIERLG
jgi:hypothetical protein